MISQFFILSPQRGDVLILRDFRHDTPQDTPGLLLDRLKTWQKDHGTEQDPPPIFNVDGLHFLFANIQGLYFVCITKFNVSPFMTYELLGRVATLIKDFCGILSEESLRLNSSLVYELLDEIIDYGYVQTTSTDRLKSYVYEDPIQVKRENILMNSLAKLKAPGTSLGSSSNRPITHSRDEKSVKPNDVFIDVIERLVASFASNGMTVRAEIDGSIQVKSYLQGNPEIRLGLNSNIVLERDKDMSRSDRYGIVFDDYKFHDSVDPTGYPNRMDVTIRIRTDIPEDRFANKCTLTVPLPSVTQSISNENMDGSNDQSVQYDNRIKNVIWTINNLQGGTEQSIKIKITGSASFSTAAEFEVGPIRQVIITLNSLKIKFIIN
ncbi:8735_t:CDS:2 [Funneliformis geosporum]|nr:8735_t:CDS:2 [Funneliformis geosporum]